MRFEADRELDCFDLEILADKFSDWKICKENEVTRQKCYLLLWHLFCGNMINPKLINDIPVEVITKAKNYILWRRLYVLDSKRPEDIEAHYLYLCRYIQLDKHMEPARYT